MRTRSVDKFLYRNYVQKAVECQQAMKDAYDKGNWNAAVVNAIHSIISSADALTVFFKGVRHAGEKHEDVITLLQTIGLDQGALKAKTRQLSRLLSIKNAAEYEERLMSKSDATSAIKDAERFLQWTKEMLGV